MGTRAATACAVWKASGTGKYSRSKAWLGNGALSASRRFMVWKVWATAKKQSAKKDGIARKANRVTESPISGPTSSDGGMSRSVAAMERHCGADRGRRRSKSLIDLSSGLNLIDLFVLILVQVCCQTGHRRLLFITQELRIGNGEMDVVTMARAV